MPQVISHIGVLTRRLHRSVVTNSVKTLCLVAVSR